MEQTDIVSEAYRLLQHRDDRSNAGHPTTVRCDICGSRDTRLVSGGKYRCLICGFLPS
ncbi:MAG: transposase [Candidatus Tectomicrobia bacterium]|nr:transposase [Candidatus Tectomicrobia bacterium]